MGMFDIRRSVAFLEVSGITYLMENQMQQNDGKLRDIWDYSVVGFLKLGIPFWGRHSILGSHWGPSTFFKLPCLFEFK